MTWEDIISSTDMSSLDNGKPAFFYQSSCENSYLELSNNLGYALLKSGAVISTMSASRVSWYGVGTWSHSASYNDNFLNMFFLLLSLNR